MRLIMLRRTQQVRKGARRTWAQLLSPSAREPDLASFHAAAAFFSALPTRTVQTFADRFQHISNKTLRKVLLDSLKELVEKGLWGDVHAQLPAAVAVLKGAPKNGSFREIAQILSGIQPDNDVCSALLSCPEAFAWWADLVSLLPCQPAHSAFYYPQFALDTLKSLLIGIHDKSLPIAHFLILRKLTSEQIAAFLQLLHIDHANEVEDSLLHILVKDFELLDFALTQVEQLHSALSEKYALEAGRKFFDAIWTQALKDFCIPEELRRLIDPRDASQLRMWLNGVGLDYDTASAVLPVSMSAFITSFRLLYPASEIDEYLRYKREFLKLAFPQFLLYLQLSPLPEDEKAAIVRDWQLYHSLPFAVYIEEMHYECADKLVAVFTRDVRELELALPMECAGKAVYSLKTGILQSQNQLATSLQTFISATSLRLFILDYSFNVAQNLSFDAVKCAIEQTALPAGKSICLLIRTSPQQPQISLPWPNRWKLLTCESVCADFSPSLSSLVPWLASDTKTLLTQIDVGKYGLEEILVAALPVQTQEHVKEIRELAHIDEFRAIIRERICIETKEFADWKKEVLRGHEGGLMQETVDRVLKEELQRLLRPIVAVLHALQAIPSFIDAPDKSLLRQCWRKTFLTLGAESLNGLQFRVQLKYPFVLWDFYRFICQLPGTMFYPLDEFDQRSVTATHNFAHESSAVSSLMSLYLADLAAMDLYESPYQSQGKQLFSAICGQAKSYKELVTRYCAHRSLVVAICNNARIPLLDDFFASLKDVSASQADVLPRLSACAAEIAYFKNPALRMYTLDKRFLHVLSCVDCTRSKARLSESIDAEQCSVLPLDAKRLFACGGQISNWARTSQSAQTYTVQLPATVTQKRNMWKERIYHGLVRVREYVYAMGGSNGQRYLLSCEKFNLEREQWDELPEMLKARRGYFTPLVYKERIYVFGGYAAVSERINPATDTFELLPIEFPGVRGCICVLSGLDTVILFSEVGRYSVNLETLQVEERGDVQVASWSVLPPVLYNNEVFIVEKDLTFKSFSLDGTVRLTLRA